MTKPGSDESPEGQQSALDKLWEIIEEQRKKSEEE